MSQTITAQIQELRSMTVNQLRDKYEEVFGEYTGARNKDYLWKRIAWKIQELKFGGLSEKARQRAREIADEQDIRIRPPKGTLDELGQVQPKPNPSKRLPAPGTILTKEYKGETIEVEVLENGFRYRDQIFRSLSAIAREVTGTNWSGPAFFGLKG